MTTIVTKNGSGAPLASDLVQGELAVDLTNKRLYTEDSGGTVIEVGTNPSTIDINAGTIDGTVIGGSSAAAGTFTTFTSTGIDDNATSTAITIDASENVGIGATSPSTYDSRANNLVVGDSGDAGITIFSGASNDARLQFAPSGDTGLNNGLIGYDNSNDKMSFATAGSDRMHIDSSGNVGIGTASPNGKLDITGSGNTDIYLNTGNNSGDNNRLFFGDTADIDVGYLSYDHGTNTMSFGVDAAERMRISSAGFVGIGTSSPDRYLHVNASRSGDWLAEIHNTHATNGYGLKIRAGDDANVTAMRVVDVSNNTLMEIQGGGNVGIGTTSPAHNLDVVGSSDDASFRIKTEGTSSTSDAILYMETGGTTGENLIFFGDADDNGVGQIRYDHNTDSMQFRTTASERMRIDSSGNVGIGTTSPASLFHISGSDPQTRLQYTGTTASFETLVNFVDKRGFVNAAVGNNLADDGVGTGEARLVFKTAISGTLSERMRIDSSGNISAGTTSVFNGARLSLNQSGGNPALACRTSSSSGTIAVAIFLDGNSTDCGSIDVNATANTTAYTTSSDQRLKENIVDAPAGNIDDVRVRSFDWKSSGYHQTYGLIAQELFDVAPEAVSKGKTEKDTWKVDYSKLVPMMIKEIQDLKAEVAALKGA